MINRLHRTLAFTRCLVYAVGLMLVGSAHASDKATYKLFGRQIGGYASTSDLSGTIGKELGPRASMADWDEIKARYGGSEEKLRAFSAQIGLGPGASAWVTQGGKPFWQEQRHYFIYRADHKLPEDFMLHDQMQNNFLLLGSWYETRPVLVKIINYNSDDAAKWAKWDKAFEASQTKDISGVYPLVSVNGKKLPATISHEGADLKIKSGAFTIKADGTCGSKVTFQPPSGNEMTMDTTASYSREGPKLNMQWKDAGRTSGIVDGNTFTMENEGMVFVYQRGT